MISISCKLNQQSNPTITVDYVPGACSTHGRNENFGRKTRREEITRKI